METPDRRPAAYRSSPGSFAISGVTERGGVPLAQLLYRAINEVFRTTDGVAYAPWSVYEPVDGAHAVVFAGADVPDDMGPQLAASVRRAIGLLHERGWTRGAVDEMRIRARQDAQDERSSGALPMRASHAHLTGQPVETTLEEVLEAMLSEDQAALDRAVADFEATTLLGIPPSVEWNDRMPMSTQPTCELPVAGTTHKVRGVPGDESFLAVWLVVQSGEVKVQHIAGPLFGGLVGAIVVQRRNNRS